MANEINLTTKLSATQNSVTVTNAVSTKVQTMESTLEKMHHTVQDVGTSAEDLSLGDIDVTKDHIISLHNRDATYPVSVIVRKDATPTDVTIAKMLPGESFHARAPGQSGGYPKYRLQATTAACDVEVVACEAGDPTA